MLLNNNQMRCQLISLHSFNADINRCENVAIVRRLSHTFKTIDYVVVRNLEINEIDLSCHWANAIQYNIESLTEATQLFINLII